MLSSKNWISNPSYPARYATLVCEKARQGRKSPGRTRYRRLIPIPFCGTMDRCLIAICGAPSVRSVRVAKCTASHIEFDFSQAVSIAEHDTADPKCDGVTTADGN